MQVSTQVTIDCNAGHNVKVSRHLLNVRDASDAASPSVALTLVSAGDFHDKMGDAKHQHNELIVISMSVHTLWGASPWLADRQARKMLPIECRR
jgi:glutaminase